MNIGVIIPDRGDRPLFLENCLRMIKAQTLQPKIIMVVDSKPVSADCDITFRYRTGYDFMRNKGLDLIAFIENDDWYSPRYLEERSKDWIAQMKPDLLGVSFTIYYHIKEFGYFPMDHSQRCSAMQTFIKPDLNFEWCPDNQPYTDSHLWELDCLNKKIYRPKEILSIGIKHGIGMTGGEMHNNRLHRYKINTGVPDPEKKFLKEMLDPESFNFYANYF